MVQYNIVGIVEVIASFHLLLLGIFLLFKHSISHEPIKYLAVFLSLLGLHFFLLSLNQFQLIEIPKFVGRILLLAYGPLLFAFAKRVVNSPRQVRSLLVYSTPFIYLAIWSVAINNGDQTFSGNHISIPIFLSNFIFTIAAIAMASKAEASQIKRLTIFTASCFFMMLAIFFSMSLMVEGGMDQVYVPMKLAFLVVLLLMTEGILFSFLKSPQLFLQRQYLKIQMKHEESYSVEDQRYDQRVVQYFEDFMMDEKNFKKDLKLSDVSDVIGFPQQHISRALNRQLSMNFRSYINDLRIKEAQVLLLSTDKKAIEVMHQVGYNSKSRFFELFNQKTGLTPNEYRLKMQAIPLNQG